MTQLLTEELDSFYLSLADVRAEIGRGLITRAARREGDLICRSSGLFLRWRGARARLY